MQNQIHKTEEELLEYFSGLREAKERRKRCVLSTGRCPDCGADLKEVGVVEVRSEIVERNLVFNGVENVFEEEGDGCFDTVDSDTTTECPECNGDLGIEREVMFGEKVFDE